MITPQRAGSPSPTSGWDAPSNPLSSAGCSRAACRLSYWKSYTLQQEWGLMAAPAPEVYLPAGRASSPLLASVLGGVTAAAVACGAMVLLRWTLQLRSLPERLMEWLLLFIPLDLFEAGLQQFGFEAKRWVLYAAIAGMFGLLAGLGAIALWRRWSLPALLGLGLGL